MKHTTAKYTIFLIALLAIFACIAQNHTTSIINQKKEQAIKARTTKTLQNTSAIEISYDTPKYTGLVDSVKRIYLKKQYTYNKTHTSVKLIFEMFPITLYPFMCLDETPENLGEVIYINGFKYTGYRNVDKLHLEHIKLAVIFYYQGKSIPSQKTYRMHYFFFNPASNVWEEDEKATDIVLELTNAAEGFYGCKDMVKK
jgi:hypothetical protein